MKMIKLFILILSVFLLPLALCARERSVEESVSVARKLLAHRYAGRSHKMAARVESHPMTVLYEQPQLRVVGYADGGFVVVAKDENVRAVWGYSDAPFDVDDISPEFVWLMTAMNASMAAGLSVGPAPTMAREQEDASVVVEPLIATRWYQSEPFNWLCPKVEAEGEQKAPLTGCVVTALAQLVNYYRHPQHGYGSMAYSYSDDYRNNHDIVLDFETLQWNYDNMLTDYTADYTEDEGMEVARLMFACGVACRAPFGVGSTAAQTPAEAVEGLRHLGYEMRDVPLKVGGEWVDLRPYFDAGKPVYFTGVSPEVGHAFLLDGYDTKGFLHCNFGWAGHDDGFYAISDLNGFTKNLCAYVVETSDNAMTCSEGVEYYLRSENRQATVVYDYLGTPRLSGDVVLPSSILYEGAEYVLTAIDSGAFSGTSIKSLTIPETVRSIGFAILQSCLDLQSITCLSPQPPQAASTICYNTRCPLFVPAESVELYRKTSPWSKFVDIRPLDDLAGMTQHTIPIGPNNFSGSISTKSSNYDLFGRKCVPAAHGIFIDNGEKVLR